MPSSQSETSPRLRRLARWSGRAFAVLGVAAVLVSTWLMAGWPTWLERLVVESDAARPGRVIVCIAGGTAAHGLPTPEGWDRIYSAVQLYADGFASTVVFSGGGTEQISEAEVYAEAARWLGLSPAAIILDPAPGSTAEHPANLLKLAGGWIARDTPLLVVTSPLHSKRVAMCFRKAGFTDFRMVTSHEARQSPLARGERRSAMASFRPNHRDYGDPLNRLRWGLNDTLIALRELVAIGVYRLRGQA